MPVTEREFADLTKDVAVMRAELGAHARALEIAQIEMNRRLEGMNKFREENVLDKQTMVTRNEWSNAHQELVTRLDEKVDSLKDRLNLTEALKDRVNSLEALKDQVNALDKFKWMATGIAIAISSLFSVLAHFIFPGNPGK